MENKICVYAICKNESQFVDRWLESMSEADYIVVLDTGSTDGTYDLLLNDSRVTKVEQKIINPWRFDVARNESLKLVPEDANILICTDLDEILHPGWAEVLREKWIDGVHIRGNYKYIWSHDDGGNPGRIFWYDKIHCRGWYWKAPVHEILASDIYAQEDEVNGTLKLFDEITLEHFPDDTKSRSSYLPLLRLRAYEDPDDYYGLFYLSHEYFYQGFYNENIALSKTLYEKYGNNFSSLEVAALFLFIGDSYHALGDTQKAIYYYNKAIEEDKTYREPYLNAAGLCNELGMFNVAIGYVQDAYKNSYRHFSWVERDNSWGVQPYDILSVAYFYIDEIDKALENVDKALEFNNSDERILNNKEIILLRKES